MKDLKEMILEGIKGAVPQSINLTKAFEVNQQKEESPGDFVQRIRDHLTKYSGVAPDSPAFDNLLKMQFVTKAWPDIQKKLQKMNWQDATISELVRTAQQVFVNREAVKQKQKSQMMVAAVQKAGAGGGGQKESLILKSTEISFAAAFPLSLPWKGGKELELCQALGLSTQLGKRKERSNRTPSDC